MQGVMCCASANSYIFGIVVSIFSHVWLKHNFWRAEAHMTIVIVMKKGDFNFLE